MARHLRFRILIDYGQGVVGETAWIEREKVEWLKARWLKRGKPKVLKVIKGYPLSTQPPRNKA